MTFIKRITHLKIFFTWLGMIMPESFSNLYQKYRHSFEISILIIYIVKLKLNNFLGNRYVIFRCVEQHSSMQSKLTIEIKDKVIVIQMRSVRVWRNYRKYESHLFMQYMSNIIRLHVPHVIKRVKYDPTRIVLFFFTNV